MESLTRTIETDKGDTKLVVNSHGARIEELVLDGQKILTKIIRGDGKEGSTHPCVPIFGKEAATSFGLPQHGSARNKDFESLTSNGVIELSQQIEDGNYPKGLRVTQKHSLVDEKYSLVTIITNNGNENLPVSFAEHFYWNTPNGWEGVAVNGKDVTDVVKKDGGIELKEENEIRIPGQRTILLKQKGFRALQLWAYKNPETGEYDSNYVCIEPGEDVSSGKFFGSTESMIKPHGIRITEVDIRLK